MCFEYVDQDVMGPEDVKDLSPLGWRPHVVTESVGRCLCPCGFQELFLLFRSVLLCRPRVL